MKRSTIRLVIFVQILLLALLIALVGWWSALLIDTKASLGPDLAELIRFRTMVLWEGAAFVFVALVVASISVFLLIRDRRRTEQLQGFFAGMTHELRTPMASIRLQAESIATRVEGDTLVLRWLERLIFDTKRMETQIDRALELVRLGRGGRLTLQPTLVHREILGWIEEEARYCGNRVQLEVHLAPATIAIAPAAIRIVFRNLIENALRHSGLDPVRVSIRGEISDSSSYRIQFENQAGETEQSFKNLGSLFVKGPTSRGSGIGLFLVKSLVEEMGGKCTFPTRLPFQVGMTFKIVGEGSE